MASASLHLAVLPFVRGGAYERHLRRLRRENERRRAALVAAIAARFGEAARVEGTDSGLHVVVWLQDLPMRSEGGIVAKARGVGVWPVSPLYAEGTRFRRERCAGLILGYAGLTTAQIEDGIERLAGAVRACPRETG